MSSLTTARLRATPVTADTSSLLAGVLTDPRVARTLGGVPDPAELTAQVERLAAHWAAHGFGYWLWRDRRTDAVVARGGLHHTILAGRAEVEVGWTVDADRWGEGLASELGEAAVAHAFGVLGLEELVAFTLPANFASRRVMEKLGFVHEDPNVEHAGLDHVLYRLRALPPEEPDGQLA